MDLGAELVRVIPLGFILDLEERIRAAGSEAKDRTREARLGSRSRPRIVGQLRTGIIEHALVEVAHQNGYAASEVGSVEGTDAYLHQAHARIGTAVVVRASIAESGTLPSTNKSRKRLLEKLNRHIDSTVDLFDPTAAEKLTSQPLAVFLLVCPNRQQEDGIGEIAIALVDSRHQEFRFYESLEAYKARYAPAAVPVSEPIQLRRKKAEPYRAPEDAPDRSDKKSGGQGA
ncbi:hypothetical protein [Methylobacterium sp. GXF4]|uniref:hypothetical protein n=1 Tax=Methylobacterium sp. GXF4 TaxID=1096546 RepID=UPI000FFF12DF|nr:hypothetical protein [Methylobacterium sp. GXF4]